MIGVGILIICGILWQFGGLRRRLSYLSGSKSKYGLLFLYGTPTGGVDNYQETNKIVEGWPSQPIYRYVPNDSKSYPFTITVELEGRPPNEPPRISWYVKGSSVVHTVQNAEFSNKNLAQYNFTMSRRKGEEIWIKIEHWDPEKSYRYSAYLRQNFSCTPGKGMEDIRQGDYWNTDLPLLCM